MQLTVLCRGLVFVSILLCIGLPIVEASHSCAHLLYEVCAKNGWSHVDKIMGKRCLSDTKDWPMRCFEFGFVMECSCEKASGFCTDLVEQICDGGVGGECAKVDPISMEICSTAKTEDWPVECTKYGSEMHCCCGKASGFCPDLVEQICGRSECSYVDPIKVKICSTTTEDWPVECTGYGSTRHCCCEKDSTSDSGDSLWIEVLSFLGSICFLIMVCICIGLCCAPEATCECLRGCCACLKACTIYLVHCIGMLCMSCCHSGQNIDPEHVIRPPAPVIRPPAPRIRPPAPVIRPPAPVIRPPAPRIRPPAPRIRPPGRVREVTIQGRHEVSACSVCMEEYPVGRRVLELPCGHRFHEQCVSEWLADHNSCPNCRAPVL